MIYGQDVIQQCLLLHHSQVMVMMGLLLNVIFPLTSMCSHHHQTIGGVVHIGYIAGEEGQVIGLSKLKPNVELFGRRGAIQEQLNICNP